MSNTSSLLRTVAPTVEPLTVAEVKTHLRLDAGAMEATPDVACTVALAGAGAGNVDNGAHRYRVSLVTATGATEGGVVSAAVTVADKTVNGKVSLTAIPVGSSAVTSRKIYRTAAGGSTYLLLTTLADNTTTTYTDNVADASLGAGAPTTNTTDDTEISTLITTVRETVEEYLRRSLLTQTWKLTMDEFPCDRRILLPRPNLLSVTSLEYRDTAEAWQTWAASGNYEVDTDSLPGRIQLAYLASWPVALAQPRSVRVMYVAGYGASAASVPKPILQGMKLLLTDLWENREVLAIGNIVNELPAVRRCLDPFRLREVV
jgi:uncharacterized phiE125 gp8 family phage protein